MRQFIHTHDVHEHANALPGWQQRYDQLSCGKVEGSLAYLELGEVRLFREQLNQSVVQQMQLPGDRLNIVLPITWPAALKRDDWIGEGVNLLPEQEGFRVVTPAGMDVLGISLPRQAVQQLVPEARFERWRQSPALQRIALPEAAMQRSITTLLGVLSGAVVHQAGALVSELVGQWLDTLDDREEHRANYCTRRYIVNRCHELLLSDPQSAWTVVELCARLKVSRRTLQYSFQSIADVTPVHYLRSLRLNCARRAMQQNTGEKIADIAARWGFSHSSYFSLEYQKLFAEKPSQLLRGAMPG